MKPKPVVMAYVGSMAPPMLMNPLWLCCGVLRVISAAPVNLDCEPMTTLNLAEWTTIASIGILAVEIVALKQVVNSTLMAWVHEIVVAKSAAAVIKRHVANLEAVFALAAIVIAPEFSVLQMPDLVGG